jgi:hypothetical protein
VPKAGTRASRLAICRALPRLSTSSRLRFLGLYRQSSARGSVHSRRRSHAKCLTDWDFASTVILQRIRLAGIVRVDAPAPLLSAAQFDVGRPVRRSARARCLQESLANVQRSGRQSRRRDRAVHSLECRAPPHRRNRHRRPSAPRHLRNHPWNPVVLPSRLRSLGAWRLVPVVRDHDLLGPFKGRSRGYAENHGWGNERRERPLGRPLRGPFPGGYIREECA